MLHQLPSNQRNMRWCVILSYIKLKQNILIALFLFIMEYLVAEGNKVLMTFLFYYSMSSWNLRR